MAERANKRRLYIMESISPLSRLDMMTVTISKENINKRAHWGLTKKCCAGESHIRGRTKLLFHTCFSHECKKYKRLRYSLLEKFLLQFKVQLKFLIYLLADSFFWNLFNVCFTALCLHKFLYLCDKFVNEFQ